MNLLNNYALLVESMKFTQIEPINEAAPDMQNAQGLTKVMSGETAYTEYSAQWNQLVKHATKNKGKDGTYTVLINHDWGAPMVNIKYAIKGGSVDRKSISLAEMPTVAASAVSTSRSTPIIDSVLQKDVDTLVYDLDGWVGPNNIKSIDSILRKYANSTAYADDDKTVIPAISRIFTLYRRDESGDELVKDLESSRNFKLDPAALKTKGNLLTFLSKYKEYESDTKI